MAKKSRHTDPKPSTFGRPPKPVDWDYVDELIVAGCNACEIAPHFNMTSQTFCYKLEEKYGINFSTYSSQMAPKGESLLRKKQFDKALDKEGDTSMLIFLGKTRLGQKETQTIDIGIEETMRYESTLEYFKRIQEERKAKPEENKPSEG